MNEGQERFNLLPIETRLRHTFQLRRAAACCSNPTPVLDEDDGGRPIVVCRNCGVMT